MAGGVNVKMGVSGIAQFKSDINSAKSAVKTLDAQLELTEKQYRNTGDAEQYMANKSQLLKTQLEAQKSIVSSAEAALKNMTDNGVDKSSKAYQDMFRTMTQAKGAMLDTEAQLNGISTAGGEAADSTERMNEDLKKIGDGINWQNVTEGLHSITSGMQTVMKKAWQMGEALVKNTLGAGSWADELMTTASQMSTAEYTVTPEDLQRMRKTATLIDTEVEAIVTARSRLYRGLGNGTEATTNALEFLGIGTEGKSNLDIFWEAGAAILALGDDAEQEAQATALFGKSWKDLMPLFRAGREEYEKTMDSWSVVSDEQVGKLGEMDDAYQKLTGEWETFKMELLGTFSGPLTEGMETLTGFVQQLNEYLQSPEGQAMLQQMGETVSSLIEDLTKVDPETIVGGLKSVVDGITDGLKWIAEHKDAVVGAAEAFVAAWGIGKGAEGIATGLKLIDAIKGLASGGATAGAAGAAGKAIGSSFGTAFLNGFVAAAPALASILGVAAVGIGVPMMAQAETEQQHEATRQARLASASMMTAGIDRDFLETATNALGLNWHGGAEGNAAQIESILRGMGSRSDLQKMQLHNLLAGSYTSMGMDTWSELQRMWGGEAMDLGRMTSILEAVTDAYQRMAEQSEKSAAAAESVKESVQGQSQNNRTEDDNLPDAIGSAVAGAIKNMPVNVTVNVDGQTVTRTVNRGLASSLGGLNQ